MMNFLKGCLISFTLLLFYWYQVILTIGIVFTTAIIITPVITLFGSVVGVLIGCFIVIGVIRVNGILFEDIIIDVEKGLMTKIYGDVK